MFIMCFSQTRHIKALKSLLVVRSSVFEKMFCGGLPEMMDVIDVMDIEPEAFYEMLRYEMIITVQRHHSLGNKINYPPTNNHAVHR